MAAPTPAVARWYQHVYSHVLGNVVDAAEAQRIYSIAFVLGQLASYWEGRLAVTVEEITTASRVGRTSAYKVLKELEAAGLLVTTDRQGQHRATRRSLAIGGKPYTIRPSDSAEHSRTAMPDSGGNSRTVPDAERTAAVRTGTDISSTPRGSSVSAACSDLADGDPDKCPKCGTAPCRRDCPARRYAPQSKTGPSSATTDALSALRDQFASKRTGGHK